MTWFEEAQSSICESISTITGRSKEDMAFTNITYRDFRHVTTADMYWRIVVKCAEEVIARPDHTFHALYKLRPKDLQEVQDHSIMLDRPDITAPYIHSEGHK